LKKQPIALKLQQKSVYGSEDWGVPELTFHEEENRVTGYGGCNQIHGAYKKGEGNKLSFSPLAATKRYCEPVMELEDQFLSVLSRVTSYQLENDTLTLRFEDDTVAARFAIKL